MDRRLSCISVLFAVVVIVGIIVFVRRCFTCIYQYLAMLIRMDASQGVKNPSLFLTLPLLLIPPVIVLKFVYWNHAQDVVSLDMVVRMFAGGFLPGGSWPCVPKWEVNCVTRVFD
jgi:RsiW-degrading membrane proteinase PrsW (M82 family)